MLPDHEADKIYQAQVKLTWAQTLVGLGVDMPLF